MEGDLQTRFNQIADSLLLPWTILADLAFSSFSMPSCRFTFSTHTHTHIYIYDNNSQDPELKKKKEENGILRRWYMQILDEIE